MDIMIFPHKITSTSFYSGSCDHRRHLSPHRLQQLVSRLEQVMLRSNIFSPYVRKNCAASSSPLNVWYGTKSTKGGVATVYLLAALIPYANNQTSQQPRRVHPL